VGTLALVLFLILFCLAGIIVIERLMSGRFVYPKSPYTGLPLRPAEGLPFNAKKKVYEFLEALNSYDNRPFRFKKAAFCRETGRIFPDCVNWRGKMKLDWSFLQKRCKGQWISWGSLSEELKRRVKERHSTMEGFQTEESSSQPSPRSVEPYFCYLRPGPLYVDLNKMTLMGWKSISGTEIELLIVQNPDR
jgi:hypothetical protein